MMKLTQAKGHWIPVGFHGTTPYIDGQDIGNLIQQALRNAPKAFRPTANDVTYIIETRIDNSKILVFEVNE